MIASHRSQLAWLLFILLLITLPYLLALVSTPDGMVFTGALLNPDDMSVYISAMRQGAASNWLYRFPYSPEPWQPRLMLLPYLVTGKVTSLVATPTVFWLHLWRVVFSFITIWAITLWVRALFPSQRQWQRTAFLLLLFGNGLGWLAVYFVSPESRLVPDIGLTEWALLIAMLNTPHFSLGFGLLTLTFVCLVKLDAVNTTRQILRWTVLAILTANLAALVYVYHLAVIGLVAGLYVLWRLVERGSWRAWLPPLLVAVSLLPLLVYYGWGGGDDPYWQRYTRHDHVIPPPPPAGVLIGFGVLGLLAIIGALWWWRRRQTPLVPLWALAQVAALYTPGVAYSGRFALGLSIPVATLAAVGLEAVLLPAAARLGRLSLSPASLRRMSLYLLVPSTAVMFLLLVKGPQVQPGFPYYLPTADVQAAEWLGTVADESSVTLAYYPLGNYLPAVYPGKVFLGQADYTTDLEQKLQLFELFWSGGMDADAQRAFLDDWQIDYLFAGTFEAPYVKAEPPANADIVYDENGVKIYAVR